MQTLTPLRASDLKPTPKDITRPGISPKQKLETELLELEGQIRLRKKEYDELLDDLDRLQQTKKTQVKQNMDEISPLVKRRKQLVIEVKRMEKVFDSLKRNETILTKEIAEFKKKELAKISSVTKGMLDEVKALDSKARRRAKKVKEEGEAVANLEEVLSIDRKKLEKREVALKTNQKVVVDKREHLDEVSRETLRLNQEAQEAASTAKTARDGAKTSLEAARRVSSEATSFKNSSEIKIKRRMRTLRTKERVLVVQDAALDPLREKLRVKIDSFTEKFEDLRMRQRELGEEKARLTSRENVVRQKKGKIRVIQKKVTAQKKDSERLHLVAKDSHENAAAKLAKADSVLKRAEKDEAASISRISFKEVELGREIGRFEAEKIKVASELKQGRKTVAEVKKEFAKKSGVVSRLKEELDNHRIALTKIGDDLDEREGEIVKTEGIASKEREESKKALARAKLAEVRATGELERSGVILKSAEKKSDKIDVGIKRRLTAIKLREKQVQADKEMLKKKEEALTSKEVWLKDREKTLSRAASELRSKGAII